MKKLIKEKTFMTFALGIVLIVLIAATRPDKPEGMWDFEFWANKMVQKNTADVILIGDSRTMHGLNPAYMSEVIPELDIFNFAFNSAALTDEYLTAANEILKNDDKPKAVIVGITSLNLSHKTNNAFIEAQRKTRYDLFMEMHFADFLGTFGPLAIDDYGEKVGHEMIGYPNGWMKVETSSFSKDKLKSYVGHFEKFQFSSEICDEFLKWVQFWHTQGVRVYAFRPSTCIEMVELEDKSCGWDIEAFIQKFTDAGGVWLEVKTENSGCYDASHLNRQGAIVLSAEVSNLVYDVENRKFRDE